MWPGGLVLGGRHVFLPGSPGSLAIINIRERLQTSMLLKKRKFIAKGAGQSDSHIILFATSE